MTVYLYDIDLGSSEVAPVRDALVELDGQTFRVVLTWRERPACWFLDLYTSDGTALLCGAALQPGSPLLLRRQGPQWPGGLLTLYALDGGQGAATLAGIGVTHQLVYATREAADYLRTAFANDEGLTFDHGS
jgi:hypothetical protein